MKTSNILLAVILMLIVAMAASCAAGKAYTSKIFGSRDSVALADSAKTAIRFLELESLEEKGEDWVTTDIIMGRDTGSKTVALDNLAKIYPAKKATDDSAIVKNEPTDSLVIVQNKSPELKAADSNANRNIVIGPVRNKRTRDDKPE